MHKISWAGREQKYAIGKISFGNPNASSDDDTVFTSDTSTTNKIDVWFTIGTKNTKCVSFWANS